MLFFSNRLHRISLLVGGISLLWVTAAQAKDKDSNWRRLAAALREDGPALRPLLPEQTILSISSHTTPETSLLLVEMLADRQLLERIGLQRETLSELLAGLQFVVPIIEDQVHPEVQVVFARQSFSDPLAPLPELRLPAVALVFRPRNVHQVRRTLLSAYWAAMLQAHETAIGRATWAPLESARRGEGFMPRPRSAIRRTLGGSARTGRIQLLLGHRHCGGYDLGQ